MHRSRQGLLAFVLTAVAVVGGVVVVVLAARAVVARPTDDAAWARGLLGVALVVWGVAFAALGRHRGRAPRPDRGLAPTTAESESEAAPGGGRRPLTVLVEVIVGTGVYAVLRGWEWNVAAALGVAVGSVALTVVNRWLNRVIERRERDGGVDEQPTTG